MVDDVQLVDGPDHPVHIVDHEARFAVLDELRDAGAAHPDDRRAGRERLDDDEAEQLVPRDREEERGGVGEELGLRGFVHLAHDPDAVAVDERLDPRLEPRTVADVDLAGKQQPPAAPAGDVDRHIGTLGRREAAEEHERGVRFRGRRARRIPNEVDAVMDGRELAPARGRPSLARRTAGDAPRG